MPQRILQPALLGGLAIGFLSGLPGVNLGNCCCCLWVVGGGILTVYLQQQRPETSETADAVLAGLLAGLVGGILSTALSLAFAHMLQPFTQGVIERLLDSLPNVPPETRTQIEEAMQQQQQWQGVARAYSLLFTVPIYAIVSMLGALLGRALFHKPAAPVAQG